MGLDGMRPCCLTMLLDDVCSGENMFFYFRCGRKGYCLEYDHDGLARVLLGVFATCKFITMVCFFLSWFFCRRIQTKEKMKDVNDERKGEEEEDREALAAASG